MGAGDYYEDTPWSCSFFNQHCWNFIFSVVEF
jgi:hypothetical protein